MRLRLTKRSDYAIRACLHLATEQRCPISSRRIAERMDIPDRFLPQIMAGLSRAGIVDAVSGKNGGYCLRRDPADISLLELIEIHDGSGLRENALGGSPCDGDPAGAFHEVWTEAQAAFIDVLAGASIAELAARQRATDTNGHVRPERIGR